MIFYFINYNTYKSDCRLKDPSGEMEIKFKQNFDNETLFLQKKPWSLLFFNWSLGQKSFPRLQAFYCR